MKLLCKKPFSLVINSSLSLTFRLEAGKDKTKGRRSGSIPSMSQRLLINYNIPLKKNISKGVDRNSGII